MQRHRLQRAQVHLAAAGDPDLAVGAHEAGHREDLHAAGGGELPGVLERGAVEGHQEVDRDRVGLHLAQGEERLDELLVALPEAGDQAAAGRESCGLGLGDGVDAVGVGVGLHDLVVVGLGGVDVVVVGVDAGVAQALGLAVLEQAQAGADLDVRVLGLDRADHVGDAIDVLVGRSAARGDHAHAGGAALEPGGGLLEGLVGVEPLVLQDVGGRAQRLGAVVAVLRAQPGLQVDQVVDLDGVAEVLATQASRGRDDLDQLVVVGPQDRECVVLGGRLAVQDAGGELVVDGHERSCVACPGAVGIGAQYADPSPVVVPWSTRWVVGGCPGRVPVQESPVHRGFLTFLGVATPMNVRKSEGSPVRPRASVTQPARPARRSPA